MFPKLLSPICHSFSCLHPNTLVAGDTLEAELGDGKEVGAHGAGGLTSELRQQAGASPAGTVNLFASKDVGWTEGRGSLG